jgi:hypothetical protein
MPVKPIDPNSDWALRNFPDAVVAAGVEWMIIEWVIKYEGNKCKDCGGNYSLEPSQFNELSRLPNETDQELRTRAIEMFRFHKRNRRQNIARGPRSPRRTSLFLCKVVKVANVTDDDRTLLSDTEVDL